MEEAFSKLTDRIKKLEERMETLEKNKSTKFQFTCAPSKPTGYSLNLADGCDGCENWGVDS